MEEKIDLLLFDKTNILIEEVNIIKPKTYYELIDIIKVQFKNLPKYYKIYYQTEYSKEIIDNNEKYKLSKDILFINEVENLEDSLFSLNYNKLSDSEKEILDEKYSCNSVHRNY